MSTETTVNTTTGLSVELKPFYECKNGTWFPCANVIIKYNDELIDINNVSCEYYFDDKLVPNFSYVTDLTTGVHNFKCSVVYNGETKIASIDALFNKFSYTKELLKK